MMFGYEDLEVWNRSIDFSVKVIEIIEVIDTGRKHYRLFDQPAYQFAAVALGASIIEKHFTLDKNMEGPDHKASLEPDELKAMVQATRNIEKALGNGIKKSITFGA